jgi:hypothetical protein
MKFNLDGLLAVDTDNKYHPVVLADSLVDIFFGSVAVLHGLQAYKFRNSPHWLLFHGTAAALSAYWPFMIHKGYTHKGLSHASYGLASAIPHVTSLQVFGSLMVLDKVYNLGDLKLPDGSDLLDKTHRPINRYGVDNMLLDNAIIPQSVNTLAVNIPWIAATGLVEKCGGETLSVVGTVAAVIGGVLTAKADWQDKVKF